MLTSVADVERVAVETLALTRIALDVHIGEEVHLDFQCAVPLAGLTAAAFDVETEATRLVPTHPRFRHLGKQLTDAIEQPCIGCWIRTWCPPNRRLINVNHLIKVLYAF